MTIEIGPQLAVAAQKITVVIVVGWMLVSSFHLPSIRRIGR